MSRPEYLDDLSLAGCTTLGVGGRARRVARVADAEALAAALADHGSGPVAVLGGGSNLLVADRGFDGLLLQSADLGRDYDPATGGLQVGAGHDWDALVRFAVEAGAAGLECLSGIPGRCGAAPVQNIGAYGQEVAPVLEAIEATELATGRSRSFGAGECGFGYRRSRFKEEEAGRWFITRLQLRLRPGGPATLAYRELVEALSDTPSPSLARVREEVLRLRRSKSMVYDPADPNHRSAGSFFTNPVVGPAELESLRRRVDGEVPHWPVEGGVKLAAAWLIQHAGFEKGYHEGNVGLSSNHVLALVNRGGARAADLLALATRVRDGVLDHFGVRLRPEPVPLGFDPAETEDLWGTQAAR